MGDYLGELERVMHGNTVRSMGSSKSHAGEWDYLRSLPARTMRVLTSAGFFTAGGELPDVAAELIRDRVAGIDNVSDAMKWYVDTAQRALAERRRESHRRRHLDVARRTGHQTYYDRRVAMAKAAGYPSLYAMRVARGWGNGRKRGVDHDWRSWSQYLESIRSSR